MSKPFIILLFDDNKNVLECIIRLLLKTPGQYFFLEKFYNENCGLLHRREISIDKEIAQRRYAVRQTIAFQKKNVLWY